MMIRDDSRAFTIIELVTVILVLSILGLFSFSFIDNAIKTYGLVKQQSPLYADGTYIMERITRELNDATVVTSPGAGSSSSRLELTRAHPSITSVVFEQDGRILKRNGTVIGANIQAFNASRSATVDGTITIELTMNSLTDPSIDFVLRTKVIPNNYWGDFGVTNRFFNGDYYEAIQ